MSTRVRPKVHPFEPFQRVQALKHPDRPLAQPAIAIVETPERCPVMRRDLRTAVPSGSRRSARRISNSARFARRRTEALAERSVRRQPRDVFCQLRGEDERSPVSSSVITSEVPPGVHRGDGYTKRARFEQHAAQRLRPVRRKDQERRMTEPPKHFLPVQPLQNFDLRRSPVTRPPSAIGVRGPRR